ncbi:MAG: hypothetical protein BAJATHORv1_30147 [Candidatus Thorarchaeota archaeon]|nr:MAG: hypothetical protein BAJATHORv1_30147 [Candidatus Thorarchaeota archaeon]
MPHQWIVNLCPFLHFNNAGTHNYEHNISIVSWNVKSILDYLDVNPDHKFCLGQVTLFEGFKRLFPNYWDALHQRILEGRIELVGGTYVLPDFVIPNGESIIRQFLLGKSYFRQEFGVEPKTGWAIDASGHFAQLPQVLRQCGIDSYVFWRGMPYDAPSEFEWKGPDGSRVNAIWLSDGFSRAAWLSENSREAFANLLKSIEKTSDRSVSQNVFLPIGGELVPPPPHLADIVSQWNDSFPDMRMVIITPHEFIEKIKSFQAKLPTISGPLISGRFTPTRSGGLSSRVRLKINSRRLETLLYLVEVYSSLLGDNSVLLDLENLWRVLLFNHDHNIIRGTIADEPYQLAMRRYRQAIEKSEELLEDAVGALCTKIGHESRHYSFVVFNPLSWTRDDIVRIPIDTTNIETEYFEIHDVSGDSIPYQILGESLPGAPVEVIFIAKELPSLGHRVYTVVQADEKPEFETEIKTGKDWMESEFYMIEFDKFNGSISRIFDKVNSVELLRSPGNYITMESDVGDLHRYEESRCVSEESEISSLRAPAQLKMLESGPIRTIFEIQGDFQGSYRTQRVSIYSDIPRIDCEVMLDYKGQDKRIRLHYPLTVFSDTITVGSQFGTEERHVIPYNSDNWAEYDEGLFPALDWVDCEGPEYGVALSAYGLHEFQFHDGTLSVTLLRSVDHLSRGLDDDIVETELALENGRFSFKIALIPHKGSWRDAAIWRRSSEQLYPLIGYPLDDAEGELLAEHSALEIKDASLHLSCYKPHENPNEFIVRFFEVDGKRSTAKITFHREIESVHLVDLCEMDIGELSSSGNSLEIDIDAHSIVTFRIKFIP